jgi:hypothetical protein
MNVPVRFGAVHLSGKPIAGSPEKLTDLTDVVFTSATTDQANGHRRGDIFINGQAVGYSPYAKVIAKGIDFVGALPDGEDKNQRTLNLIGLADSVISHLIATRPNGGSPTQIEPANNVSTHGEPLTADAFLQGIKPAALTTPTITALSESAPDKITFKYRPV